jgi:hypothetical protein
MFGFLKLQSNGRYDPLRSPAAAGEWLHGDAFEDATMRQRRVLAAVLDYPQSPHPLDRDRIAALLWLDAAAEPDRRRLLAQYVANADRSPAVANAVWETLHQQNRAFIAAYRCVQDGADAAGENAMRSVPFAELLARHVRCLGLDARLQAFRYQRWIPAKWDALNACYRLAAAHGVLGVPPPLDAAQPDAPRLTVLQEYLAALLFARVDSGNLAPAEIDFVSERLQRGARDLALAVAPKSPHDFCVDIAGRRGLERRTAAPSPTLRYLDAAPLIAQLRREIAALAAHRATAPALSDRQRECRIAALDKTWRALAPASGPDLRGAPREAAAMAATVRFGLAEICVSLAGANPGDDRGMPAGATRISSSLAATLADLDSIARIQGAPRHGRRAEANAAMPGRTTWPDLRPAWTVVDRSITGLRIRGPVDAARGLAIGTLAAVHAGDTGESILCVVCRLFRISSDVIEAGLSIVAGRVVPATLHTSCLARDDMHIVVDGIDLSAMGAIFRGLYVPPKVRRDAAHGGGTLIVPTSNHDCGRRVVLAAGDEVRTVILREPLERAGDWTWTTFEVAPAVAAVAM